MLETTESLMILIAGPYRSGTGDVPAKLAANVRAMEDYALTLFRAGHLPIVGEWLALPLVAPLFTVDGVVGAIHEPSVVLVRARVGVEVRL